MDYSNIASAFKLKDLTSVELCDSAINKITYCPLNYIDGHKHWSLYTSDMKKSTENKIKAITAKRLSLLNK